MSSTLKSTRGWATLGPKLGAFPLEQTRHVGVANSEHPRLTNGKLFSKNSNLCDQNPPTSQTDRQTTCDRNTALCTKVHRAVKSKNIIKYGIKIFIHLIVLFMLSSMLFSRGRSWCARWRRDKLMMRMRIRLRRRNAAVVMTTILVILLVAAACLGLIDVTPWSPSPAVDVNVWWWVTDV